MLIEAFYDDMHYEQFDTSNQTVSDPWAKYGTNVLTEWDLVFDDIENNGVRLVQWWYEGLRNYPDGKKNIDDLKMIEVRGVKTPLAERTIGFSACLVSPENLKHLMWLRRDGSLLLWREGDEDLVNGVQLILAEQLHYKNSEIASLNKRVYELYCVFLEQYPKMSNDEIASMIGYSERTINRIIEEVDEEDKLAKEQTEIESEDD